MLVSQWEDCLKEKSEKYWYWSLIAQYHTVLKWIMGLSSQTLETVQG